MQKADSIARPSASADRRWTATRDSTTVMVNVHSDAPRTARATAALRLKPLRLERLRDRLAFNMLLLMQAVWSTRDWRFG